MKRFLIKKYSVNPLLIFMGFLFLLCFFLIGAFAIIQLGVYSTRTSERSMDFILQSRLHTHVLNFIGGL